MLSLASNKAKLSAKIFSKNSNFDESGIPLPAFPSRTYLKLHNIHGTPKLVKVITNLNLINKVSGPDCIPVVVLKNCAPELSFILAEGIVFKPVLLNPVFNIVGDRPMSRLTVLLLFFLWLVKSLENL